MTEFKKNKYVCSECSHTIVTVDLADGSTPAYLACKGSSACQGLMQSSFYSPAQVGDAEPTHEWYRPNREERRSGNAAYRKYYANGGLALRRISES